MYDVLNQRHSCLATLLTHKVGPNAGLRFTDVRLVQEHHAEATLANTSANAKRKLAVEKAMMEI